MQDRREGGGGGVFLGGIAGLTELNSTTDCVVRNVSERGACVEADETSMLPEEINPNIPRKGRSFLADIIWRYAGRLSQAFRAMVTDPHSSDLDERLRRSQIKQRQLQRRIEQLLREG